MKIIQLPSTYGKSIIAIHQAVNKKAPLVVKDDNARERVKLFAANMADCANCKLIHEDCKKLEILTFDEFLELNKDGWYSNCEVVIDDFDLFVNKVLRINPDTLTITTK